MSYTDPVTDRTLADITGKTAKGYFNLADWQRIYNNALALNALIASVYGVTVEFTAIAEPTITTWPSVTDVNALLVNIENMRAYLSVPDGIGLLDLKTDWLAGGSVDAPDYENVNEWERQVDLMLNAIAASLSYRVYCGVAAVGQVRYYQVRWRDLYVWVQPSASPVLRPRTGVAICGRSMVHQNKFRRYD